MNTGSWPIPDHGSGKRCFKDGVHTAGMTLARNEAVGLGVVFSVLPGSADLDINTVSTGAARRSIARE